MKIALGSDHRGNVAMDAVAAFLKDNGHQPITDAVCSCESCDYPDNAYRVAKRVASGEADLGILACGSGIGVSIAANKVDGVRAALVMDQTAAEMCRRHNNANVLCLSADRTQPHDLIAIVDAWLTAEFEGGRHQRRVEKIHAIERGVDPSKLDPSEIKQSATTA